MRLTVKTINDELSKCGHRARLQKGDGYFYFSGGEAVDWLDRTVNVPSLNVRARLRPRLEIERLEKLTTEILRAAQRKEPKAEGP